MRIILDDKYCLNLKSGTTTVALSIQDGVKSTRKGKDTGEMVETITDKDIRWFNNISDALTTYVKLATVEDKDEVETTLAGYLEIMQEVVDRVMPIKKKLEEK